MFTQRVLEVAFGTAVVVLASTWIREKRPGQRASGLLLGVWWVAWAAAAGFSVFALARANASLSAPSEDRLDLLSTWLDRAAISRLASTAVLVLGLAGVFLAWARGGRRGAGGDGPGDERRATR